MNKENPQPTIFGVPIMPEGSNKFRFYIGKSIYNYINYILIIICIWHYIEIGLFSTDHSNYNNYDVSSPYAEAFIWMLTNIFNLLNLTNSVGNFILACSLTILVCAFILPMISLLITGIIATPIMIILDFKKFVQNLKKSVIRNTKPCIGIAALIVIHISTTGVISILALIFIIPFILMWKEVAD